MAPLNGRNFGEHVLLVTSQFIDRPRRALFVMFTVIAVVTAVGFPRLRIDTSASSLVPMNGKSVLGKTSLVETRYERLAVLVTPRERSGAISDREITQVADVLSRRPEIAPDSTISSSTLPVLTVENNWISVRSDVSQKSQIGSAMLSADQTTALLLATVVAPLTFEAISQIRQDCRRAVGTHYVILVGGDAVAQVELGEPLSKSGMGRTHFRYHNLSIGLCRL